MVTALVRSSWRHGPKFVWCNNFQDDMISFFFLILNTLVIKQKCLPLTKTTDHLQDLNLSHWLINLLITHLL